MFGTAPEPVKSEPAQTTATEPHSPLVDQAQAFFAGFGGKVFVGSAPRPVRPGNAPPRRFAPSAPTAATYRSFAAPGDDAAARAREQEMAAEAEIIDDTFDDFDAPGC